jgi:hypothetical protein
MPHIKNIIDTDCYIEFDNATELRLFSKRNEIDLEWLICIDDRFIRLYADGSTARSTNHVDDEYDLPIYHQNNVTEWKPVYRERDEDDMYQDYVDSQL